jgi:hypothetical protein
MSVIHKKLHELAPSPDLGRDIDAVVLIKWTNQQYHDDNLRAMFTDNWDPISGISKSNTWRHRNQYYDGLIVQTSLDNDILTSARSQKVEHSIQPTDIDITPEKVVIAAGNRLIVRDNMDESDTQTVISNPWFARLHSAEFTRNDTILTVSSAFDQIFEVDMNGEIVWEMDIWNNGRNVNRLGHFLVKNSSGYENISENTDVEILKQATTDPSIVHYISDPRAYGGLGLPTNVAPAFVNAVSQVGEDKLLATSFRYGEAWVIDKAKRTIDVALENLTNPHGFIATPNGFMVTNTGEETVIFFDSELQPTHMLDVGVMEDRKKGLEQSRWLQNSVHLEGDIYATYSAPRQKLTLFDMNLSEYRDIDVDPSWGLQTLANLNCS